MTRHHGIFFVAVFVLIGMLATVAWLYRTGRFSAPRPESIGEPKEPVDGAVRLYFPGADGRLHEELRALDASGGSVELTERLVASLIAGPDTEGLFAPLPASTTVGSVFLASDGTLYLDLMSTEHPVPPVSGSQREILAAYSVINSVCGNVPGVRGVALLWNGEQRTTFAGNLDTTRPLGPNRRLVSSG